MPSEERTLLDAVGISTLEERVYRTLLEHPSASLAALARDSGRSVTQVRNALASLQEKGLVSRVPEKSKARYLPESPEVAIGVFLQHREHELEQARGALKELVEAFRQTTRGSAEPVHVLTGRRAIGQRFLQMSMDATQEMLGFVLPPYATSEEESLPVEQEALARDVTVRAVYDDTALENPGLATIEQAVQAGEDARFAHNLPMKLAIQDRAVGLIPLRQGDPGLDAALVVEASALLDALIRLFEEIWEDATPLSTVKEGAAPSAGDELPFEEQRPLLTLLGAGLKDEAIARQLGVSTRTIERRVSEIMTRVKARTRFECALRLAERNWLQ